MLVGGVLVGRLSERLGLAVVLRAGIGVFSLAMLLSAAAPGVPLLGLGRLIAGIGLGVVMPGCMSITRSRRRRTSASREASARAVAAGSRSVSTPAVCGRRASGPKAAPPL